LTVEVLTVKVIEVLPAGIVTDLGSVAEVALLDSEITAPPVGAAEDIVAVPVLDLPPTTDVGFSDRELSIGAVTVRSAILLDPLKLAVIGAVAEMPIGVVLMANVAVVLPLGTTTVAGTVAHDAPLVSFTVIPAAGAGPLSVTIPDEGVPPATTHVPRLRETSEGGVTVRLAVFDVVPILPVMVAAV